MNACEFNFGGKRWSMCYLYSKSHIVSFYPPKSQMGQSAVCEHNNHAEKRHSPDLYRSSFLQNDLPTHNWLANFQTFILLLCRSCHMPDWLLMGLSGPLESRRVSVSACQCTVLLLVQGRQWGNSFAFELENDIHLGQACLLLIISRDKES